MKVNGNDPTLNLDVQEDGGFLVSSIPIRLEIASRLLAGKMVAAIPGSHNTEQWIIRDDVPSALRIADALIKAHNDTCGGE